MDARRGDRRVAPRPPDAPRSDDRAALARIDRHRRARRRGRAAGARVRRRGPARNVQTRGALEWCDRRLLARIHRYTLNRLRAEIEPVSAADFMRFLFAWHTSIVHKLRGIDGLRAVLAHLDGFEVAAGAWERTVLPARVDVLRAVVLDMLCLTGESAGRGSRPPRARRQRHTGRAVPARARDAWHSLRDESDDRAERRARKRPRNAARARSVISPASSASPRTPWRPRDRGSHRLRRLRRPARAPRGSPNAAREFAGRWSLLVSRPPRPRTPSRSRPARCCAVPASSSAAARARTTPRRGASSRASPADWKPVARSAAAASSPASPANSSRCPRPSNACARSAATTVLTLLDEGAETIARVSWRLAALALLVYLTRNAVLRSREVYADVRASIHDGRGRGACVALLAGLPAPAAGWAGAPLAAPSRSRESAFGRSTTHGRSSASARSSHSARESQRRSPTRTWSRSSRSSTSIRSTCVSSQRSRSPPSQPGSSATRSGARPSPRLPTVGRGFQRCGSGSRLLRAFCSARSFRSRRPAATDDDALLASGLIQGDDLLSGRGARRRPRSVHGLARRPLPRTGSVRFGNRRRGSPRRSRCSPPRAWLSVFMAVFYIARDTREVFEVSAAGRSSSTRRSRRRRGPVPSGSGRR